MRLSRLIRESTDFLIHQLEPLIGRFGESTIRPTIDVSVQPRRPDSGDDLPNLLGTSYSMTIPANNSAAALTFRDALKFRAGLSQKLAQRSTREDERENNVAQ